MTTKQIGDYGENVAAAYLEYKNYEILNRNYRIRGGEIDIIARDKNECVVFVEVKTRTRTDYGLAMEYVNTKKQERIKSTAIKYTGRSDISMRFDIIEVYYEIISNKINVTKINHIKNAF